MKSTISEFKGDASLKRAVVKHSPSGSEAEKEIDGAFIFIGYVPNTEKFKEMITINDR